MVRQRAGRSDQRTASASATATDAVTAWARNRRRIRGGRRRRRRTQRRRRLRARVRRSRTARRPSRPGAATHTPGQGARRQADRTRRADRARSSGRQGSRSAARRRSPCVVSLCRSPIAAVRSHTACSHRTAGTYRARSRRRPRRRSRRCTVPSRPSPPTTHDAGTSSTRAAAADHAGLLITMPFTLLHRAERAAERPPTGSRRTALPRSTLAFLELWRSAPAGRTCDR